ncbi:MAG: CotH kinase family protein [Candidatus Hermodarchaeota archaeon]
MSYQSRFENKIRLRRRKKELIAFLILASFMISVITFYTYIENSPDIPSNYPKINISCQGEPNMDDYIDCKFELLCENSKYSIYQTAAKIIRRGSSEGSGADRWPKKSYRISLDNPESLLGMRKDDDWLLFSMYIDYPRLKIKTSMDIWNSLEDYNPTVVPIESKYVCLYLNGEFQGLYLLSEKNERKLFGLDDAQNNIHSSVIFQVKYPSYLTSYLSTNWEQDWPNEDEGIFIMDEMMTDLINFIANSDDDTFFDSENGIFSRFDELNLIDFYLFNYFIAHKDFWNKNYFIIRDTYPNKFYLFPWDYDYSMGQWMSNTHDAKNNPEKEIREINHLYDRLLENTEFKSACKERWIFLRNELWTDEFIMDLLTDNYNYIKDILEIDTEKWNPVHLYEKWDNNVDIYVTHLFNWLPERLEYCDYYFNSF